MVKAATTVLFVVAYVDFCIGGAMDIAATPSNSEATFSGRGSVERWSVRAARRCRRQKLTPVVTGATQGTEVFVRNEPGNVAICIVALWSAICLASIIFGLGVWSIVSVIVFPVGPMVLMSAHQVISALYAASDPFDLS